MKQFLAAALIFAVFSSCKTPSFGARDESLPRAVTEPAAAETDAPAVEEKEPAAETADAGEPALEEEPPSVEDFPDAPPEEPVELPAPDPLPREPELPRVITFLDPPPEEVTDQDYPEPEPPDLPPLPGLAQVPEEAPAPSAPESEPPAPVEEPPLPEPAPSVSALPPPVEEPPPPEPAPSVPTPPPPVEEPLPVPGAAPLPEESPPPPPAPPPLIRPAESAGARPSPREALPVPVNPVPDPPARQPPVAVRPAPSEPRPPAQALTVPDRTGPVISPAPASPETGDTLSYSRTIRGTTGQVLEVPFRGTGWVYLGEANAGRGISYLSRRADPEGQTFIFRLDEIGEYELRFYKQDFIRDYILNDHVRVIVEDGPKGNSFFYPEEPARLVAEPRWPPPENPAGRTDSNGVSPSTDPLDEQSPETAAAGQGAAAPETMAGQGVVAPETAAAGQDTAAPETAELLPAALLGRAREAYEAGRFPDALAALDEFRLKFPLGSDEAWWLYGQLLESAGPRRDIRGALEYYRRLIREYPQSPRCDDARKRIAYLERFYFNIR